MRRRTYMTLLAIALGLLCALELVAEKGSLGARQALFGSSNVSFGDFASSPAWMATVIVLLGIELWGLKLLSLGDAVFNLVWTLWFLFGFMAHLPNSWFFVGLLLVVFGGTGLRRRLNGDTPRSDEEGAA